MRINKIVLKPNYVEIESSSENSKGNNVTVKWKSEVPPEEEFKKVFNSLNGYVSDLCGIENQDKITVHTVNIGYKDDSMKIIISCTKDLEVGSPLCFNTPLRWINSENNDINLTPQASQIIDEIIELAEDFMKKEYQMNLFNKEAA